MTAALVPDTLSVLNEALRPMPKPQCGRLPGIGPRYFREFAEVMNPAAGGPPNRAKLAETMLRHSDVRSAAGGL